MTRAFLFLACVLGATPLAAQPNAVDPRSIADRAPVRRLEIAAGGLWLGGASLGEGDAALLSNGTGATPTPYRLFTTHGRFAGAPGIEARVGVALSRTWSVEASVVFARPEVRTAVSGDVEQAAALTARERIDQYFIDVGMVRHLRRWTFGGRAVPFLAAGAGYLRQLHQDRYLVESGQVYRAGGGMTFWLHARDHGVGRAVALRLDGRAHVPRGALRVARPTRVHPAVSGTVVVVF